MSDGLPDFVLMAGVWNSVAVRDELAKDGVANNHGQKTAYCNRNGCGATDSPKVTHRCSSGMNAGHESLKSNRRKLVSCTAAAAFVLLAMTRPGFEQSSSVRLVLIK